MESDELLARSLQTTFDEEYATPTSSSLANKLKPSESLPLSDDYWEIADPNPDIHALFQEFNKQYFWGKLSGIEVRWSPRMTLCAGLCCYEGRGGLCSVRLSVPLLKLRPRKDLVDTLLHEMIHAYLFVTQNFRDHDGHGPEFHKHMYRINREAGTHITVYHTFHNEVSLYKQHWWKCNGPCKNRPPYFGLVKRSMNRKPGPYDPWWKHHEQACGGSYVKIKEPEGYKSKSKHKKESQKNGNNSENSTVGLPFKGKGRSLGLSEPFKKNELNSNTSHFKKSAPNESNPLSAFLAKASGSTSSSGLISPFTKNGIIAGKNIKDKTKGQNITKSSQKSVLNGSDKSSTCAAKTKSFLSPEKTINQLRIDYFLKREVTKVENISDIKTASIQKHANSKNIVKEKTAKRKLKDEAENLPEKKYKVKSEFTKSGDLPSTSRENLKNPIVDLTISYVKCPACDVSINENKINQHLDECLM